ncbi:MAG: hypothetical protein NC123_14975 [Butyrivibrio sp.]|nr:hypothetical protein [Butyrivibrio sp.]
MAEKDEFFDEKIIDMMNKSEEKETNSEFNRSEEEKHSIYNGIKIYGKWIYFERCPFANDTITMMLPKNFVQMDPDMAKKKYPSEQRPETILTDETGAVNLMFQYMEGEADDATIESLSNQIFGMMKRVNPGIKERELGSVDTSGKKIAYVEFSNPVMDGKLYNLMFFLAVKGRPLMGSFNCRTKEMKYWRTVAFEMIQSIEIIESEE